MSRAARGATAVCGRDDAPRPESRTRLRPEKRQGETTRSRGPPLLGSFFFFCCCCCFLLFLFYFWVLVFFCVFWCFLMFFVVFYCFFIIFDIIFGFLRFFCVGCTHFRRKLLLLDDFWAVLFFTIFLFLLVCLCFFLFAVSILCFGFGVFVCICLSFVVRLFVCLCFCVCVFVTEGPMTVGSNGRIKIPPQGLRGTIPDSPGRFGGDSNRICFSVWCRCRERGAAAPRTPRKDTRITLPPSPALRGPAPAGGRRDLVSLRGVRGAAAPRSRHLHQTNKQILSKGNTTRILKK